MTELETDVIGVLRDVLGPAAAASLGPGSALLGSVPELDSMAVVAILTAIEERFGFAVADDEVEGTTFASVDSLVEFVRAKLAA